MPKPDRAPAARGAPLTTSRLCAAASATRGMLRLYEAEGLLAPPAKSSPPATSTPLACWAESTSR